MSKDEAIATFRYLRVMSVVAMAMAVFGFILHPRGISHNELIIGRTVFAVGFVGALVLRILVGKKLKRVGS